MKSTKLKCARCGVRFKPPTRGRPPQFCCASCRQAAYFDRRIRVQRDPFSLLAQDLNHTLVRAVIRREVWEILRQIGAIGGSARLPDPKDPPRPMLVENLRRLGLDAQSFKESFDRLSGDERDRLRDTEPPDEPHN